MRISVSTERDRHNANLIGFQLLNLAVVGVAWLGLWVVEAVSPGFFKYPFLSWEVNWSTIQGFWPLFAYCLAMSLAITAIKDKEEGRSSLVLAVSTSILAGIWEELGFRYVFICYAMISIVVMNFLLSTVLGTVIGLGLCVFAVLAFLDKGAGNKILGAGMIVLGATALYLTWSIGGDPLFWLYRNVFIPVIDFVTFGQFHGIFHNGYPELFLFGLVSANARFRAGHQYQGPIGLLNSWITGYVYMFAMLHYGLATAIAIHILYDLEIDVIRFVFKK
ncbi:MAG: hypothetical protein HGA31_02070 [Candidatus Moranbacteria bacterium]|nr:hypothetical protein [Candidatus Moranbacteria bacterium]